MREVRTERWPRPYKQGDVLGLSWVGRSHRRLLNREGCGLRYEEIFFNSLFHYYDYSNFCGVPTPGNGEGNGTHSSTLAWKIPWMKEPGRLQSMGSLRVWHDWATSLSLFTFMHWRRKWQPTLVFLPGESQGRGSLVGCRLWGRTESDMPEVT